MKCGEVEFSVFMRFVNCVLYMADVVWKPLAPLRCPPPDFDDDRE
jgi:hypothetical protein